jgi:histone acetyltransferase (RNA polymerase elongator complex component)
MDFSHTFDKVMYSLPIHKLNKYRIEVKLMPGLKAFKRSINLNKLVATFEKHIFLSQSDLTRTGIISNSYNEMFEA